MSKRTIRLVNVGLLVAVAALCVACAGAAAKQKRMNDLKQIGLAYHNFCDSNFGKAPTAPQDLINVDPTAAPAIALLQNGEVVFIWGVKIQDMKQGTANTILAYEAGVPTNGGIVLMADGSVRQVTAAEFQQTPKAQPPQK